MDDDEEEDVDAAEEDITIKMKKGYLSTHSERFYTWFFVIFPCILILSRSYYAQIKFTYPTI